MTGITQSNPDEQHSADRRPAMSSEEKFTEVYQLVSLNHQVTIDGDIIFMRHDVVPDNVCGIYLLHTRGQRRSPMYRLMNEKKMKKKYKHENFPIGSSH